MICNGSLLPEEVRDYLTAEGKKLQAKGADYYYAVRERFNKSGDPLDFIFLNRSCFNGVVRFNNKGEFNVPFCHKPNRFRQGYVTKIVNQIIRIRQIVRGKDWEFRIGDWRNILENVTENDFVYLDPPYIGRHTDYYQQWSVQDAADLAKTVLNLPCGFALSTWKANKYRTNLHITYYWHGLIERTCSHFYHVGSTENLRNYMEEALLIKPGYEAVNLEPVHSLDSLQLELALPSKVD